MNVTLIALVRQGGSWARAPRLKELGMKQERLFYEYTGRHSSKWFIVLLDALIGFRGLMLQRYPSIMTHFQDH